MCQNYSRWLLWRSMAHSPSKEGVCLSRISARGQAWAGPQKEAQQELDLPFWCLFLREAQVNCALYFPTSFFTCHDFVGGNLEHSRKIGFRESLRRLLGFLVLRALAEEACVRGPGRLSESVQYGEPT